MPSNTANLLFIGYLETRPEKMRLSLLSLLKRKFREVAARRGITVEPLPPFVYPKEELIDISLTPIDGISERQFLSRGSAVIYLSRKISSWLKGVVEKVPKGSKIYLVAQDKENSLQPSACVSMQENRLTVSFSLSLAVAKN